jgi:hypothetical protein
MLPILAPPRLRRFRLLLLAGLALALVGGGFAVYRSFSHPPPRDGGPAGAGEPKPEAAVEPEPEAAVEHFAHVVFRRGRPEGVGPVADDDLPRRNLTYRLSRRGGRVEEVRAVNGHGGPAVVPPLGRLFDGAADGPDGRWPGECRLRFRYQKDQLTAVEAEDVARILLWVFRFDAPDRGHYLDRRGFPCTRPGTGVWGLAFEWTAEGRPGVVRYLDRFGRPAPGLGGAAGLRRAFDPRGLAVRETCLDEGGKPAWHRLGYARLERQYNARGNETEAACFGPDDKPAWHHDGYCRVAVTFDDLDQAREQRYFGADGRPTPDGHGAARLTTTYDEHGDATELAYYGLDGRPTRGPESAISDGGALRRARHPRRDHAPGRRQEAHNRQGRGRARGPHARRPRPADRGAAPVRRRQARLGLRRLRPPGPRVRPARQRRRRDLPRPGRAARLAPPRLQPSHPHLRRA